VVAVPGVFFFSLFVLFCTMNFNITIFLSLFLRPLLVLLFWCYNPLFSLPTTLSAPSYPLSPHVLITPSYPSPICHHTDPPSYTLTTCPADNPTVLTVHTLSPLQFLIQAPSKSGNIYKHT
jgi:hypothetical protein